MSAPQPTSAEAERKDAEEVVSQYLYSESGAWAGDDDETDRTGQEVVTRLIDHWSAEDFARIKAQAQAREREERAQKH